jgi:hypothetical protein
MRDYPRPVPGRGLLGLLRGTHPPYTPRRMGFLDRRRNRGGAALEVGGVPGAALGGGHNRHPLRHQVVEAGHDLGRGIARHVLARLRAYSRAVSRVALATGHRCVRKKSLFLPPPSHIRVSHTVKPNVALDPVYVALPGAVGHGASVAAQPSVVRRFRSLTQEMYDVARSRAFPPRKGATTDR